MDANEAARHVIDNWKKITGLPKKAMHEEGSFPDEVIDFLRDANVDEEEFTQAWVELLG